VDTLEQVVGRRVRRRQLRSIEEKLTIIEKTLVPGASVAEVALAHGVNANLLFTWRRKYRQGQIVGSKKEVPNLLPVRVVRTSAGKEEVARSVQALDQHLGQIQIELPKGHLMVTGSVDVEALRVVLEKLAG
jgi:transposase